ncbi:MAG: hypothetical protein ACKV1O_04430 [Saprospiraceae bacterium]
MNWYLVSYTTSHKIAGSVVPQADVLWSPETPFVDLSPYLHNPVPHQLKIPTIKLKYRAKLTDLISANLENLPAYTIISKKFFQLLLNFHTPRFQSFEMAAIDKKNIHHPYHFFMQNSPQYDLADYSRSVFSRMVKNESGQYVHENFQATSYEEVRSQKGTHAYSLYLRENIEWDSFILAGPPSLWMVNQKVADALREAKITGICLIPFHQGENFVDDDIVSKAQRVEGTL